MSVTVGIDLGTTNSVLAVLEGGEPTVVVNAEGARTTPSVVAWAKSGEVLVGAVAKRQAVTNPDRTVSSVKRHMGTSWSTTVDGKRFTPQEVSARVLMKLKRDAESYLGQTVSKAVITVPAYFDDAQRQATKEAGEIAGLEVLRLVAEPTAAALAYGLDRDATDETIVVFDLGGGTFDVSVLDIADGVFEVRATAGDSRLGGDDFDEALTAHLVTTFRNDHGVDLSKDRMAMQRLRQAAEKAKIELSSAASTTVNLPFLTATDAGPLHFDLELTRATFEQLIAPLLDRCREPFRRALADADVSRPDKVVLVGGSTRVPAVQALVAELSGGVEPTRGVNPDEVVALGAALQAGVIGGQLKNVLLLDVTPLTLGIETMGGVMTEMIARNTTIPARHTEVFSTAEDSQSSVDIHVLQGERPMASDNKTLGTFKLTGILPAPSGVPQIEVTFDIDANGIVHVSAKDLATGRAQSVTISGSTALSKDEVARMVAAAAANEAADQARRSRVERANEASTLVQRTRRMLADSGDRLDATTRDDLAAAATALERAVASGDDQAVDAGQRRLAELTARAAEQLYRTGAPSAAAAAPGPTDAWVPDGDMDGDVVDAEIVDD